MSVKYKSDNYILLVEDGGVASLGLVGTESSCGDLKGGLIHVEEVEPQCTLHPKTSLAAMAKDCLEKERKTKS